MGQTQLFIYFEYLVYLILLHVSAVQIDHYQGEHGNTK